MDNDISDDEINMYPINEYKSFKKSNDILKDTHIANNLSKSIYAKENKA